MIVSFHCVKLSHHIPLTVEIFSDEPTAAGMDPLAVNCLPREEDLARIKRWGCYVIAKELTEYHPNLKKFSGVIK